MAKADQLRIDSQQLFLPKLPNANRLEEVGHPPSALAEKVVHDGGQTRLIDGGQRLPLAVDSRDHCLAFRICVALPHRWPQQGEYVGL